MSRPGKPVPPQGRQYPQSQPRALPPYQYPPTSITPSASTSFSHFTPTPKSLISTPNPPRSKLQALPQSQALDSALNDTDLDTLKALLRASGNLYPHMRTMALRFLLGDKYVEQEKKEGWGIEGLNVDGKPTSVDHERRNFGVSTNEDNGKERRLNSGMTQSIPEKAVVIDLLGDGEDSSQQKSSNPGKAREREKPKDAVEQAFQDENSRRIKAELAFDAEVRKREIAEQELQSANKRTEQAQRAFAEEQKTRHSQEELWKDDQHSLEHYKNLLARETPDIKSLASAAQQYINVVEAGCHARMLDAAKIGTTAKRWTEMYEKIYGFDLEYNEMAKDLKSMENVSSLEESLMVEKKKRATTLAELEAAREEIKRVTMNYQSEWRQVEGLQRQISQMQVNAMGTQNLGPDLRTKGDTVEQASQGANQSVEILQKQLNAERKETKRLTEVLEMQRRIPSRNIAPTLAPQLINASANASKKELEDLRDSLKAEKSRSEWFKEQFADQQNKYREIEITASTIQIDKEDVSKKLHEEIKRRRTAEKSLREATERSISNRRNNLGVGGTPSARVEFSPEKVLAEMKESLNARTRIQTTTSEPSSSKKRKTNPKLEEFVLKKEITKFTGG